MAGPDCFIQSWYAERGSLAGTLGVSSTMRASRLRIPAARVQSIAMLSQSASLFRNIAVCALCYVACVTAGTVLCAEAAPQG